MSEVVGVFLLAAIVLAAAVADVRSRRLPNLLTYGGVAVGMLFSLVPGGVTPLGSLIGMLAAGGLFFMVWCFRGIGAGDVKLMAAVGAFAGFPEVLDVIFFSALCGGLLGLGWLIWAPASTGTEGAPLKLRDRLKREKIPFAVATAVGVLIWVGLFLFGLPF